MEINRRYEANIMQNLRCVTLAVLFYYPFSEHLSAVQL